MLSFLTVPIWEALVWANIVVGGAWAIYCLYRDLTGPDRFAADESSYSNGPPGPASND